MKQGILLSFLALSILSACEHKEEKTEVKKFTLSDSMMHMVQIDTVSYCNIDDQITLNGEIGFNENNLVKVFPRTGGQVITSKVSLGDKVGKGQVLATIRSADIAGTYSDLSSADADLAIAKRQLDNTESLYKSGISSEREYTEAKQNYEKAMAAKHKVQSVINITGGGSITKGGEYILRAPIDGYIVEKKISEGSFIRPDAGDNLFTISDLKNVWVKANVYEADIPKVREGYEVTVTPIAYPDKQYAGKIDKINQVLDPQSKVMQVRITLENKEMILKPDMFAKVVVDNTEGSKASCIPSTALVSQEGKNYVVVYHARDNMEIAEVQVIKTTGDKTYVSSGLQPGVQLITKDQLFIFNQLLNE